MAGLVTSAVMAVSVMVVSPTAPHNAPHWTGAPGATLSQVVENWAAASGRPAPVIDAAVGAYAVGQVSLAAADYCQATTRLIAALSHAETRPALVGCGASDQPLVIVARRQG